MNTRDLKTGVKAAAAYLADNGIDVPHTRLLEALARGIGERNWATLRAMLDQPAESTAPAAANPAAAAPTQWDPSQGQMTDAQFVWHGGSRCPCCGSTSVDAGNLEADGPTAWDETTCGKCGASWKTAYSVSGYFDVESGMPPASAKVSGSATSPYQADDVLVFVGFNAGSLQYRSEAYSASAAWSALTNSVVDADGKSAQELVREFYAIGYDCVSFLAEAEVPSLFSCERAGAVQAYNAACEAMRAQGCHPLEEYRENVVVELVEHVTHMAKKYGWSVNTFERWFEMASESDDMLDLEASVLELIQAATRLS